LKKRGAEEGLGRKTEVVSIRLDPKLKYLAELCARKQRRTLSSYIEWAIERSLSEVMIDDDWQGIGLSVAEAEKKYHLWDVDEPDRLVQLATKYPELLTLDEQVLWKTVQTHFYLITYKDGKSHWTELLRDQWESIQAEAAMNRTLGRRKSTRRGDESPKEES
jgi:hypothetical protein